MHKILVTGGAGYVGSALVPVLLGLGFYVIVYDTWWFGDHITAHPNLRKVKADIRDITCFKSILRANPGIIAVIHMACISNDPSVELDESLSRTINYEAFEPLVVAAKEAGVKRFIYCSTSSVYGVSDAPNVTEEHPLVPLTLYNTYKGQCEPLLFKHQSDDFTCVTIRPSTICGYSPRQRLDLAVNILTNHAVTNGKIILFGGKQMRPNLHIEDMVDCYVELLMALPGVVGGQIFNVGARNYSLEQLAEIVKGVVEKEYTGKPIIIERQPITDERSYQVDSSKIARMLGWSPQRTVEDAVLDLCDAFKAGRLPNSMTDTNYINVAHMRNIWAEVYKDAPPSKFDPRAGVLSEIDMLRGAGGVRG